MGEHETIRTLVIILVWLAVAGGLLLVVQWFRAGGAKAFGPEDELAEAARASGHADEPRVASFSASNLALHGLLGVLAAALATYAVARDTDRGTGYVASLVMVGLTAVVGAYMFWKWKTDWRPRLEGEEVAGERVEDELPKPVVYVHGLAAVGVLALLVVLLLVD